MFSSIFPEGVNGHSEAWLFRGGFMILVGEEVVQIVPEFQELAELMPHMELIQQYGAHDVMQRCDFWGRFGDEIVPLAALGCLFKLCGVADVLEIHLCILLL